MKDYIAAATVTNSGNFHGDRIPLHAFLRSIRKLIAAAEELDVIKKTLFYGRPHPYLSVTDDAIITLYGASKGIDPSIIHGVVGIATEAGELCANLHKALMATFLPHDFELDTVNLKEEGGDLLWYLALLFNALDTDFTTEARRNISKLMLRYPNGFTVENALVRNITAERVLLEAEPLDGVFTVISEGN